MFWCPFTVMDPEITAGLQQIQRLQLRVHRVQGRHCYPLASARMMNPVSYYARMP